MSEREHRNGSVQESTHTQKQRTAPVVSRSKTTIKNTKTKVRTVLENGQQPDELELNADKAPTAKELADIEEEIPDEVTTASTGRVSFDMHGKMTTGVPILKIEQESQLTNKMVVARNAWRSAILQNPFAQRLALDCYKEAARQKFRGLQGMFDYDDRKNVRPVDAKELAENVEPLVQRNIKFAKGGAAKPRNAKEIASRMEGLRLHTDILLEIHNVMRRENAHLQQMYAKAKKSTPKYQERLLYIGQTRQQLEQDIQQATRLHAEWNAIRHHLALANVRLVQHLANRYRDRGVAFEDLFADGTAGLLTAIDRYDPEMGVKLASYATWWIRQTLQYSIARNTRGLELPAQILNSVIPRMTVFIAQYTQEHQQRPLVEQIAKHVGVTPELMRMILSSSIVRTNVMEDEYNDFSILETCVDKSQQDTSLEIDTEIVPSLLKRLPERERVIVEFRYGLRTPTTEEVDRMNARAAELGVDVDDEKLENGLTLRQVSYIIGVSRERVRQIEGRAMEKLQNFAKEKLSRGLFAEEA